MDELNKSYEAISANESLSEALKDNFKQLITVFHQTFNEVDLSNFNERIKRLRIKKGSKYITKDSCDYNPKENVLVLFKYSLIFKNSDCISDSSVDALKYISTSYNLSL